MKKHNGGYSLVEILIAMALLAIITIPTCTSLVLSVRINAGTDKMLKAQLAVSSTVEILMAEGIGGVDYANRFDDVEVKTEEDGQGYWVTVTSTVDESVTVTTYIRKDPTATTETAGENSQ